MRLECGLVAPLNDALSVGRRGGPYARVLCATDLSPVGDSAVRVACALTAPGGVLQLLHVYEPACGSSPLDTICHLMYAPKPEELRDVEARARKRLRHLRLQVGHPDVCTEEILLHHENVPEAIVDQARRTDADVIVVGTRARAGPGRLFLGSVALDLLLRSPVPIVFVHDPEKGTPGR